MNAAFINIHTHNEIANSAEVALINYFPDQLKEIPSCCFSVGIHPCDLEYEKQLSLFDNIIQDSHPQAIGECGIDRNSTLSTEIQIEIFQHQAIIAQELNLPLIIHCVGRFQELILLRKKMYVTKPWIIHGFTGSIQLAKQLIDNGFLLSFGSALLTHKGKAEESLKHIPSDTFFLETDNDDRFSIAEIYAQAAIIRNVDQLILIQQIDTLFRTIF